MPQINGQIIRILDKKNIIINLGSIHGIDNSSIFSILSTPEEIIDPFTSEVLGQVPIIKSKVKAIQVYPKFTIASSRWTNRKISNFITRATSISSILSDAVDEEQIDEELNVEENDVQPWKAKSEIPVRVGDIVITNVMEMVKEKDLDEKPSIEKQDTTKNNSEPAKE